ncbi:GGDEF domain-containing protein [Arsenicicoccus sp. UBA7492]|uniref:GGDEF domain-containing protein n=1 Tax=Arsenicicoccus sp. UBA7492 TaxID=1946057 RepID=UPI002580D108|nr:GGDEF domain-containing protein [Arsenicicoccus sp. UBA7492]
MTERPLVFRVAAMVAAGVLVTYLWLPVEHRLDLATVAIAVVPLTFLAGILLYRPPGRAIWWTLLVGTAAWGILSLPLTLMRAELVGGVLVGDVMSIVGYVVVIAGVVSASGRVTSEAARSVALDGTIFGLGCAAVIWSFAAETQATESSIAFTTVTSPLLDLLVIIAASRIVLTSGGAPSPVLLVLGMSAMTVGDVLQLADPIRVQGGYSSAVFWYVVSAFVAGLGALHPSMARFAGRSRRPSAGLERIQLTVLAVAAVMPPLMLLREHDRPQGLSAWPLLLMTAVVFGLVMLRLGRMMRLVDQQRGQLQALARTDHLTSLPNRRTGEAEMHRMVAEAVEQDVSLVVALLDLDHFKGFNDLHGHPAGDRLLETTASAWRRSLPPDVFLSRHGGEEFLMLAKGRHPDNVRLLLEGLRGAAQTGQTFSGGVAVWDGIESVAAMVARADVALYAAKAGGRDAVRFSEVRPVVLQGVDA